jgi:hypothetical protein
MAMRFGTVAGLVVAAFAAGVYTGGGAGARAQGTGRVFELRTYTAAEGKLQTLSDRFRDRTLTIFKKHGMQAVGVWIPTDAPHSANTLVFLMEWPSREEADKTWQRFGEDPAWKALVVETEKDGRLWTKLDRLWMRPTEYSPMK